MSDVSGGDALALLRAGVEADERLARRDADANVQSERRIVGVQLGEIASRTASAARTARCGVVLVGDRRSEDRDDGVADELLDGAAEVLELLP